MNNVSIDLDAIANVIGMMDGIEPEMDAGPEDLDAIESLTYKVLCLRDQLTSCQRSGFSDAIAAMKSGNKSKLKRNQVAYQDFWRSILELARTSQRLVVALAGCRRMELRTASTGLSPSDVDWLVKFLHSRF